MADTLDPPSPIDLTAFLDAIRALGGSNIVPATPCGEKWFGLYRAMAPTGRGMQGTWHLFITSAMDIMRQMTGPSFVAARLEEMIGGEPMLLYTPAEPVERCEADPARCRSKERDAAAVVDCFNIMTPLYGAVETLTGLFAVGCSLGVAEQDRDAVLAFLKGLQPHYAALAQGEANAAVKH